MKKKYYVNLSYQVIVEAESDAEAIRNSFYEAAYNETVRHISAKVVRVELPIQPPQPVQNVPDGMMLAPIPQVLHDETSKPESDIPI